MFIEREKYTDEYEKHSLASLRIRQISDDFNSARRKALLSVIRSKILRRQDSLLSYGEVRALAGNGSERHVGIKRVPIDHIVGAEKGQRDFTHDFFPRRGAPRERWQEIDLAFYEDAILPPVKLYEIGGVYFVRDGNCIVSVARTRKRLYLDADVTYVDTNITIEAGMNIEEIVPTTLSDHMIQNCLSGTA